MDVNPASRTLPRPLPRGLGAPIAAGWRRARGVHANLALSLEDFEADVVALVERSRRRLDLETDAGALGAEVHNLHFEDLYLARLCERGDERAWHALLERYQPDLRGVLQRSCGAAEAESVAAEVLAELALAPPKGGSRTRLGTYDGTGPLWAWLATFGVRSLRARWRKRREHLLAAPPEQAAVEPPPAAEIDDQVQTFVEALRGGWLQLELLERLALVWKHRDGLAQRAIGRLLGVSEPTVSRLVGRGTLKLRSAIDLDAAGMLEPALWTHLERALGAFLESSEAPTPPEEA